MMKSFIVPVMCLIFISCAKTSKVSLAEEKEKILALHNAQKKYHFEKDSIAFVNQLSENFVSVNKGKITTPQKEETLRRYNGYFSSVDFIEWDDVSDPIIKFSEDGTMAYTIVDKIVKVQYTDKKNKKVEGQTHFAWTAIYKKYGDSWKIDCVTSTNQPDITAFLDKEEKIKATTRLLLQEGLQLYDHTPTIFRNHNRKTESWRILKLKNNDRIVIIDSYKAPVFYQEIYFEQNGNLVYAKEIERHMPLNQKAQISWHCEFFIENGKIITYESLGHGKTENEDWKPESIFDLYTSRLKDLSSIN